MSQLHTRHLNQYFIPKNYSSSPSASAAESSPSPQPAYDSPWGNASLNYGSRVGFAAGAAIGVIILICVFILLCDRRRRPYIGQAPHHLGGRPLSTYLLPAQMADMGPRKVEWPVLVVNPDNEIECGRKLYDDKSAPSKEDPSNYFESPGPGPPLFEANILLQPSTASGHLRNLSGSSTGYAGPFQSFRQRFRRSTEFGPATQSVPNAAGANSADAIVVTDAAVPVHTSDNMPLSQAVDSAAESSTAPSSQQETVRSRWSFRSPFTDWNPATGLANNTRDSTANYVELSSDRTANNGTLHRRGSSQGV